MSSRRKGKCCSKELCKHEKLELCPQYKCSLCKGIVHLLCGSVDEKTDEQYCLRCTLKCAAKPNKSKKQCSSCSGYGYERKSLMLCPHYGKKGPQNCPPSGTTIMGG
eukprot:15362264-Ditylum_brightwellii.AAC.1